MTKIRSMTDLLHMQEQITAQRDREQDLPRVIIGMGTCGIAAGAKDVLLAVKDELNARRLAVKVCQTGCIGMCEQEPLLDVELSDGERVTYGKVTPALARKIIAEHVGSGHAVKASALARLPRGAASTDNSGVPTYREMDLFKKQNRIVLRNCGLIDPENLEEYIACSGYQALGKVLAEMAPEQVIEEVKLSGLRGRGGAGFSTGQKWQFARQAAGNIKYVICNADEGDPGAFMDRSVMEGDPHTLIEGMIIAGYAIGAQEGYIYVRAEYPLAIRRLLTAIGQAEALGLLGDDILSSGFNFRLHIKEGAGAFVCGEETALMASIEGRRGMPRPRPPFPANHGLWGKPTNINNVETYANVPVLILDGGAKFAGIGTAKSKGTKVFALTGKIKNTGLVEVPMGITLREIIFEMGGGTSSGKEFKAVQIGGPSGGCIPAELLDLPIDYDSLVQAGAMMGSGGLVVMDSDMCMVNLARFFLNFTQAESCGKCTPCREGTKRMLEILARITEGKGREGDIELLIQLGETVKQTSLCGLGQTAANPVLSTLRYFRHEYEAHILEKRCPAGACTALLNHSINAEKCRGCSLCKKVCPVQAISGKVKEAHSIDNSLCINCSACMEACRFGAIIKA